MQEKKDTRSLAELFSELALETRTLLRKEMELLRTEMKDKMTGMVKDVAAIGIGGVLLLFSFLTLIAAIVFGVAEFLPLWISALLVSILLGVTGFVFVQKGRKDLSQLNIKPEKSTATIKETVQWAKSRVR